MTQERLSSLARILRQPIGREADVIHLLVEVRSVIELMEQRFRILKFFCDWVLHPRMDRNPAREILRTFDNLLAGSRMNPWVALQVMNQSRPLTSLAGFRDDLLIFLAEHRLDTTLICSLDRLEKFLGAYVDRIAMTPLKADVSFKNLDEIRVRKLTVPSTTQKDAGEHFAFGIEWMFNQRGVTRQTIVNDVWLPARPAIVPVVIAKLERRQGQIQLIPQESQTLWNPKVRAPQS